MLAWRMSNLFRRGHCAARFTGKMAYLPRNICQWREQRRPFFLCFLTLIISLACACGPSPSSLTSRTPSQWWYRRDRCLSQMPSVPWPLRPWCGSAPSPRLHRRRALLTAASHASHSSAARHLRPHHRRPNPARPSLLDHQPPPLLPHHSLQRWQAQAFRGAATALAQLETLHRPPQL